MARRKYEGPAAPAPAPARARAAKASQPGAESAAAARARGAAALAAAAPHRLRDVLAWARPLLADELPARQCLSVPRRFLDRQHLVVGLLALPAH